MANLHTIRKPAASTSENKESLQADPLDSIPFQADPSSQTTSKTRPLTTNEKTVVFQEHIVNNVVIHTPAY